MLRKDRHPNTDLSLETDLVVSDAQADAAHPTEFGAGFKRGSASYAAPDLGLTLAEHALEAPAEPAPLAEVIYLRDLPVVDDAATPCWTETLGNGCRVQIPRAQIGACIAEGTEVMTPGGLRKAEDLQAGDLLLTRDNGFQPLVWAGVRHVKGDSSFAPIEFAPGALGNDAALRVSPHQSVVMEDFRAAYYLGEEAVLVPAAYLVDGQTVRQKPGVEARFVYLMTAAHEVILAGGVWSETYLPDSRSLAALPDDARAALMAAMPVLDAEPDSYGPAALPLASREESLMFTG